jgi:hypothetical protein
MSIRQTFTCSWVILAALTLAVPAEAQSSSVTLAWDPNPESDVAGYVLSWGTQQGLYTHSTTVGNVTEWTVSGLEPDRRYYFTVQAYNDLGLYSQRAAPVSNDGLIVQAPDGSVPSNVDQRPSIFWHHRSSGAIYTWHLSGSTVFDTRPLSIPAVTDVNWKVSATGDFNGDGHPDILWRHATEGWLALWTLHYNTVISTQFLTVNRVADPNWQIRGAGDMDGDGNADIVWQHASGRLAVWLMRGELVRTTLPLNLSTSGTWNVAAVTDLDGDGISDLVWHDSADGRLAVWLMNRHSITVRSTERLSVPAVTDLNWRIEAAGRIDGTGVAGLLWRHQTTGTVAVWYISGSLVLQTHYTDPSRVHDVDWIVVGGR